VVNQLRNDVGGTVNVDTGAASLRTDLLSIVYLGETLVLPCPYCTGDVVAADGNRDGTCVAGQNAGQTCDTDAFNYSFPAPGGAGHSLDCYPTTGKNITGLGLRIDLRPTTGTTPQISANLPCFFGTDTCHCLLCSGDQSIPCDSDADCAAAGAGTCSAGASSTQENSCNGGACTALDPSEGECTTGPDDHFCDAVLRADGEGFVFCNDNADCTNSTCGAGDCGSCTLTQRRRCFPQSFQAAGVPDPARPIMASTFCIPKTANTGVNSTAGLPGPAKVVNQSRGQSFCASDPGVAYTPGVGGCP
jgi:hypothetical protein